MGGLFIVRAVIATHRKFTFRYQHHLALAVVINLQRQHQCFDGLLGAFVARHRGCEVRKSVLRQFNQRLTGRDVCDFQGAVRRDRAATGVIDEDLCARRRILERQRQP